MIDAGVPAGTWETALAWARRLASLVGGDVDTGALAAVVALPYATHPAPTAPAPPVPWGHGALCVDLGPDDGTTWETFRGVIGDDLDPASVAARAQVWRLPVVDYREHRGAHRPLPDVSEPTGLDLRGVTVVDLTSMWAGPLATRLLAGLGAEVHKIEPTCRPDGLRFGDGDSGIGDAPMFRVLNDAKRIHDLDLRRCGDRTAFDRLVRRADLVVDSLSPRARDNLGVTHADLAAVNGDVRSLSITAFSPGSPRDRWVAYGTGVHAASGLGDVGACVGEPAFAQPAYSYPDPLAGLMAACRAVEQLAGRAGPDERVSLADAVATIGGRLVAGTPQVSPGAVALPVGVS